MSKSVEQYEFVGLRFRPDAGKLEVCETDLKFSLSQIQRNFLLALLENPGEVVTYDELRAKVWPHEPEMDSRVQHTIHVTKRNLVRLLEGKGIKADFIESAPGRGYRLAAEVRSDSAEEKREVADGQNDEGFPSSRLDEMVGPEIPTYQEPLTLPPQPPIRHSTYIAVSSVLYGLLFWLALLIETAYQFDVYGSMALSLGLPVMAINTAAAGVALLVGQKRLRKGKGGGLLIALGIIIVAVSATCWLASLCLPDTPVTLTRLQAQPAFAAFLKNAIVYFLPLCVFLVLLPFYFIVAVESEALKIIAARPYDVIFMRPYSLILACTAAMIYSLISTFYMLDNLLPGTYHGLFVSLIFMRFVVYFSLGFSSALWYKSTLNRISAHYSGSHLRASE